MEQAIDDLVVEPLTTITTHRGQYKKYSPEFRAQIVHYAAQNGNAAATREFAVNESTARRFKQKYCEAALTTFQNR